MLGIVVLLAGLSATLSSASSDAIAGVTTVVRDLYKILFNKMPPPERVVFISRVALAATTGAALVMALTANNVIDYIKMMVSLFLTGMCVVGLLGAFGLATMQQEPLPRFSALQQLPSCSNFRKAGRSTGVIQLSLPYPYRLGLECSSHWSLGQIASQMHRPLRYFLMNVDRWKTEIILNMKTTLRSILLLGLTGTAFQASAEQPNLIFILADDQGYGDVSYAGGLAPPRPTLTA